MNVLYTGPLRPGSLTEGRRRGLVELGVTVTPLDQVPYLERGPWWRSIQPHALIGPGISAYNDDIIDAVRTGRPDVVYVDTAVYLWPGTIAAVAPLTGALVHFTSEYVEYRSYQYRHLRRTARLFDLHVLTQRRNEPWFVRNGARAIAFTEFGYDPAWHRRPVLNETERREWTSQVVFVGHWEPAYEASVQALRRAGVDVRVHGPGWHRSRLVDAALIRPLAPAQYLRALAGAKIGLGLLSRWNCNETASRTFEIPAIGTFLLAERTAAHARLYREGGEAEFFADASELVEKARHYLAADDLRERIAAAGHRRCTTSGYRHLDRMGDLLNTLRAAVAARPGAAAGIA